MNSNFETMMEQMMEQMMVKMMEKTMTKMFSSMMEPEIANAEVEKTSQKKATTMTKEEFFALEDTTVSSKDYSVLDFEPINAKTLKYNGYVPSDIWVVNHLAITSQYGGKWNPRLKGYTFETHADAVNFAQSYKIKTELDDKDRHNIKIYKFEKAKAKAEYYAKKAEGNFAKYEAPMMNAVAEMVEIEKE